MAWLRLDDGFTKHPKFEGWTAEQKWAWLEVMEYCARYGTGGRIPSDLKLLPKSTTKWLLNRAEKSGWIDVNPQGELLIHDWHLYNPKDPTAAERQARRRAKIAAFSHGEVTAASRASHALDRDPNRDPNRDSRAGTRARSRPQDQNLLRASERITTDAPRSLADEHASGEDPEPDLQGIGPVVLSELERLQAKEATT